jgi:hypothetical protein
MLVIYHATPHPQPFLRLGTGRPEDFFSRF